MTKCALAITPIAYAPSLIRKLTMSFRVSFCQNCISLRGVGCTRLESFCEEYFFIAGVCLYRSRPKHKVKDEAHCGCHRNNNPSSQWPIDSLPCRRRTHRFFNPE